MPSQKIQQRDRSQPTVASYFNAHGVAGYISCRFNLLHCGAMASEELLRNAKETSSCSEPLISFFVFAGGRLLLWNSRKHVG